MLSIFLEGQRGPAAEITVHSENSVYLQDLVDWIESHFPLQREDFYLIHNGKKLQDNTALYNGIVRAVPRLVGGKGGFGSMLRAIGAQIEKTTNREACRDLSGRRLRDINEEQRLKNWISKKADREREALERKKRKLEKLRSEPKVEFSDKKYEEERSKLTDVVHDAVEKGFQASSSSAGPSSVKRKPQRRKGFMLEEEEFSDETVSSSEESSGSGSGDNGLKQKIESDSDSDGPSPAKKQHVEGVKSVESSHSSDGESSSEDEQEESQNSPQGK